MRVCAAKWIFLAAAIMLSACPLPGAPAADKRPESAYAGARLIAQMQQAGMLAWRRDFSAALQEARQLKRWVLVDVYTDWCGWCKKMDRDTFADPDIARMLDRSFVCVKVNAEAGPQGEQVKRSYQVRGFPCILILEPSGRLKGRISGYRSPDEFEEALRQVFK